MEDIYSIGELSDRMAITDVYARYVHATDDKDYDELDRLFLPDTVFDWTAVGHVRAEWDPTVRAEYIRNGQFFVADFHHATGFRISFNQDRSEAYVKSKMLNATATRTDNGEIVASQIHGGYSDVLVRHPDGWKIVSRLWNHKFITVGHHTAGNSGGLLESDRA